MSKMEIEELEEMTNSSELVPDVVRHILSFSYYWSDLQYLKTMRLVARSWNVALQSEIAKRSICTLRRENIPEFINFILSDVSMELQFSSVQRIVINLDNKTDPNLKIFERLPEFFLAQIRSLTLEFEECNFNGSVFQQIINTLERIPGSSLEELHMTSKKYRDTSPTSGSGLNSNYASGRVFHGNLPLLTKLTIPFHCVLPFLETGCSLFHLSLEFHNTEIPTDFWTNFRTSASRHSSSLGELFLVGKTSLYLNGTIDIPFHQFTLCNFGLNKFVFDPNHVITHVNEELAKFVKQQAGTLQFLELPNQNIIFGSEIIFPKLEEFRFQIFSHHSISENLSQRFPLLKTIMLPNTNLSDYNGLGFTALDIRNVSTFYELNREISASLFNIFPNMEKLEILDSEIEDRFALHNILSKGIQLRSLSFSFQFNIFDKRSLSRNPARGPHVVTEYDEDGYNHRKALNLLERPVKGDCFLLGFKPSDCRPFYTGQTPCTATTEFPIPTEPSLINFHNLEYLSLEGHFTELTIWAGIAKLTQLQELHLKSQDKFHPKTFLELETHLPAIRKWSFTKRQETPHYIRDMYKFFRRLPNILAEDQVYIWKFQDYRVERRVCTALEFDELDLTYAGKEFLVPENFFKDQEFRSGSDSDDLGDTSDDEQSRNSPRRSSSPDFVELAIGGEMELI